MQKGDFADQCSALNKSELDTGSHVCDNINKKPKGHRNEQKKNNKSSFDLSRADNSKSPTLNISQGRGI